MPLSSRRRQNTQTTVSEHGQGKWAPSKPSSWLCDRWYLNELHVHRAVSWQYRRARESKGIHQGGEDVGDGGGRRKTSAVPFKHQCTRPHSVLEHTSRLTDCHGQQEETDNGRGREGRVVMKKGC
eukprot:1154605-Pelagomonas_calceolata.AAC.1